MTDISDRAREPIPITQEDRDAAARLTGEEAMAYGMADLSDAVQAFARHRIEAGVREAEWPLIETAPRDGTHILACNMRESFGYRDGPLPPIQTVVHWHEDGFYTSVNELAPTRPFPATHWKPLDAPALTPPSPSAGGHPDPSPSTKREDER